MTTLQPRGPYSPEELKKLYPDDLQLQLVQVFMRHGERSPVSARFRNAGLEAYWPYCAAARKMVSAVMHDNDPSKWGSLDWRRRLETFGLDDGPVMATGPKGEVDAVCNLGELTDKGRQTTYDLGKRLRHLYVDQLHFMPAMIHDADMMYLRATPIPRALESLQQAFWGMYPLSARTASFPRMTIVTRVPSDETLFPNDGNCRRFAQLSRAFAQRTADRWNNSPDMDYVNNLLSKWMPEHSKRVAVDSHPRLSGIMDTVNSTKAHGPETRLPKEFYDEKSHKIIEKIGVEEWFSGYAESQEYRALGIGSLMGDIVSRMVGSVEMNGKDGLFAVGETSHEVPRGRGGEKSVKMALSGCHDTTLGAILASLGTFDGEPWPPYTSHVSLELFRKKNIPSASELGQNAVSDRSTDAVGEGSFFSKFFPSKKEVLATSIGRTKMENLSESEKRKLDGYFVRVRYNDRPMTIPGCKLPGKHLDGDESFCTLEAFKTIVDKYVPSHWKRGCVSNLDAPAIPDQLEPGGY